MEVTSNRDMMIDGLSELTTRQNPNSKNSYIFYDSDTMLRENELFDFH